MSFVNPLYTDTVTIFNRKEGGRMEGDVWYPTVVKCCRLSIDRAAIMQKYGPTSADNAELSIVYTQEDGNIMIAGKKYVLPKEYEKLENPEDHITFASSDIFWEGEWTQGISVDADYGMESFYSYMNRVYDHVFTISSASRFKMIPHFELLGK